MSEGDTAKKTPTRPRWRVVRNGRGWDRFYRAERAVPYLRDGVMVVRVSLEDWSGFGVPTVELAAEVGYRGPGRRTVYPEAYNVDALTKADRTEIRRQYDRAAAILRDWTTAIRRKARA